MRWMQEPGMGDNVTQAEGRSDATRQWLHEEEEDGAEEEDEDDEEEKHHEEERRLSRKRIM